jgi:photosystem II stability/assembly factor-like uncharacterized protein
VYADSSRFYFNGIDCTDTQTCWAVAEGPEGGWILATTNGGATWTEQLFVPTGGFFQVKMVNAREGWAAGGIYKAYVGPACRGRLALSVPDGTPGHRQTFDALFVSTRDGGLTWTEEPVIPNAVANALDVVDMDHAYATAFLRSGASSLMAYRANKN